MGTRIATTPGGGAPEPDRRRRPERRLIGPGGALRLAVFVAAAIGGLAAPAAAQNGNGRPNVFFDCSGPRCDSRYYRTEITWVNWVNDKEDSNVHLIMTSQTTGAGGREYLLHFIGTGDQASYDDEHRYQVAPDRTPTGRRSTGSSTAWGSGWPSSRTRPDTGVSSSSVRSDREEAAVARGVVARDEVVGSVEPLGVPRSTGKWGSTARRPSAAPVWKVGFSASRVTPDWRVRFSGDIENDHFSIELSDGTFDRHANRLEPGYPGRVCPPRSLVGRARHQHQPKPDLQPAVPDRSGARAGVQHLPLRRRRPAAASSSTMRSVPAYRDYAETTIYGETEETRWEQALDVRFSQRQRWGNASDQRAADRTSCTISSQRLMSPRRGTSRVPDLPGPLELEVSGATSRQVNDQIYLAAEEATDEEALLRLQAAGDRVRLRRGGRLRVPVRVHLQQRGEQPLPAPPVLRPGPAARRRSGQ